MRGRELGEVPALFERMFRALGLPDEAFAIVTSELDALERALSDAVPGDLIAVLVHLDEEDVQAFLSRP